MTHGLTQIFPSMSSHQYQLMTCCKHPVKIFISKMIISVYSGLQRIDNRIAGYEDASRINIFLQQIPLAGSSGRKMHISHSTSQLAVHFLRIGRILVTGSQACFHMAHRNLGIEGSQRSREGSGGVAMHQHHVGLGLLHNGLQTHQGACSYII